MLRNQNYKLIFALLLQMVGLYFIDYLHIHNFWVESLIAILTLLIRIQHD